MVARQIFRAILTPSLKHSVHPSAQALIETDLVGLGPSRYKHSQKVICCILDIAWFSFSSVIFISFIYLNLIFLHSLGDEDDDDSIYWTLYARTLLQNSYIQCLTPSLNTVGKCHYIPHLQVRKLRFTNISNVPTTLNSQSLAQLRLCICWIKEPKFKS